MTKKTAAYIVQTSAANMPISCWGTYRRVAVLAVDDASVIKVAMISSRARHVVDVVATWEKLNCGTSSRCAYQRALTEAHALAEKLNAALVAECPACNAPCDGPVPPYCSEHDGNYSDFLVSCNCD